MPKVVKSKVIDAELLADALERLADAVRRHPKNSPVQTSWDDFENIYRTLTERNDSTLPPGLPIRFRFRHTQDPSTNVYIFTMEAGKFGTTKSRLHAKQRNLVDEREFDVPRVPD